MIREQVICDVCGAERKEVNHWWVIVENNADGLSIWPWPTSSMATGAKHVCGQACAHKLLNEFFERRAA